MRSNKIKMICDSAAIHALTGKQCNIAGKTDRAIVMGGSIAGLAAARVLSDHFGEVVLVERDQFGESGEHRRGVPQGGHSHGLLASGLNTLQNLFPGFLREAIDAGALYGDRTRDGHFCLGGGELVRFESGIEGLLISRPLLEGLVRERVRSINNVRLYDGCRVQGLTTTPDNARVTGVRLRGVTLTATLVVDATGRGSHSPEWLEAMGYARPKEERIEPNICYVTRRFRRCPWHLNGALFTIIAARPEGKRGGVMLAQEDGSWIVTLFAYCGGSVPAEHDAFVEFASTIPAPYIHDVVSQAEPLGDAQTFRFRASVRRRYERMKRFPEGYLVLGDAICSFNPAYGQGMSVALLEVLELDKAIRTGPAHLARRFFGQVAKLVDSPWAVAAGGDLRFPELAGRRSALSRLRGWYFAKLNIGARHDPSLALALERVANLLAPPESLLHPFVIGRVLSSVFFNSPPLPAHQSFSQV